MIGSNNEVAIDQYILSLIEACQLKQEHRPHSNTFVRADEYEYSYYWNHQILTLQI